MLSIKETKSQILVHVNHFFFFNPKSEYYIENENQINNINENEIPVDK
jgi:hypothetical protein